MSKVYLFADVNSSQNSNHAFGPVNNDEYRVQSTHNTQASANVPAIAVVGGMLYAVRETGNEEYITLILRPNQEELLEIFGYEIAFMVYKRIRIDSIFETENGNGQFKVKEDSNLPEHHIISRLWALNEAYSGSGDPGSNMLGLHITSAEVGNDEPIDHLFRYDDAFNPIKVDAGDILGNFEGENGGGNASLAFEIYLHRFIEDHQAKEVRNFENIVTVASGHPQEQRHKRERILNYLDPAAFYGEYCKEGNKVVVTDTSFGQQEHEGKSAIYNNILNRFANKDAVYIDIRNDNFYSYNFYEQFDLSGSNLRFQFAGFSEITIPYGTGGSTDDVWPVKVFRTGDISNPGGHNDENINLSLRLIPYENARSNVFIANRTIRRNQDGMYWVPLIQSGDYKRRIKNLDTESDWTTSFNVHVNYFSGQGLVASYIQVQYSMREIPSVTNDDYFPKKGLLDNLFPLLNIPQLMSHENGAMRFVTGFRRFVYFQHEDDENIPFSFYGIFKFAITVEPEGANSRIILQAFADELFLGEKFIRGDNNLDGIEEEDNDETGPDIPSGSDVNEFFGLDFPGMSPVISLENVNTDQNPIPILKFEPPLVQGGEVPVFNLQPNYLTIFLTREEYVGLLNYADSQMGLESDFHFPFIFLGQEHYESDREYFGPEQAQEGRRRFATYYRVPLGIKGFYENSSGDSEYSETYDGQQGGLALQGDTLLRTLNQLVFSTIEAANNQSDAIHLQYVSDHYLTLPDEVFDNSASNYGEVVEVKKALREVYSCIPHQLTFFWAKHIHGDDVYDGEFASSRLKTAIGLITEDAPNEMFVPIITGLQNHPYSEYPYEHIYVNSLRGVYDELTDDQNQNRLSKLAGMAMSSRVNTPYLVYRQSPVTIFQSRPGDFQDPDSRFELIRLFLDTLAFSSENKDVFTGLSKIDEVFGKKEFANYINSKYEESLPNNPVHNEPILKNDETDYHSYFDLAWGTVDGQYRRPGEIADNFRPKLNILARSSSQLNKDVRELWTVLHKLLGILNLADSVSTENAALPWNFPPFYFYGNDPDNPQINAELNAIGSPLADFNNLFNNGNGYLDQIASYYQNTLGESFTYRQYLEHIFIILSCYSSSPRDFPSDQDVRFSFFYNDRFSSQLNEYLSDFYIHFCVLVNADSINGTLSYLGQLGVSTAEQDAVKRLYYADIISHELGHLIVKIINPGVDYVFDEIGGAHIQTGDINQMFPTYPYYHGMGHLRGSYTGNISCEFGNKVEKILNRKHYDLLNTIIVSGHPQGDVSNLYQLREFHRRSFHVYEAGTNNLPDPAKLPDPIPTKDHGYCFNNMNPK
jgi:hypothetical protein